MARRMIALRAARSLSMNQKILYALWGGLYILCAGLGFIPNPAGAGRIALILVALVFFLPGAVLLYRSGKAGDRKTARVVRNLSLASLGLTLVALVLNFLSPRMSAGMGDLLYGLLVIVSSPMVCSQHWFMSMFCWACLLMASLSRLRKKADG